MVKSIQLKRKIMDVFKNKENMKNKLLACDEDAINQIAIISQKGIAPEDIVEAYENNAMEYLYKQAKKRIELKEIYQGLCDEVTRDIIEER